MRVRPILFCLALTCCVNNAAGADRTAPAPLDSLESQIIAVGQRALETGLAERYAGLQAQPTGHFRLPRCVAPKNLPSVGIATIDTPLRFSKRLRALVSVQCSGEARHWVPVWFSPEGELEVWTADADLSKGDIVVAGAAHRIRVPVSTLHNEPFVGDAAELAALRVRNAVAATDVITVTDLEAVPAVRKGMPVTVAVQQGTVRLNLQATALHDATIGQPVMVRNPAGGGEFRAMVKARNVAQVGE